MGLVCSRLRFDCTAYTITATATDAKLTTHAATHAAVATVATVTTAATVHTVHTVTTVTTSIATLTTLTTLTTSLATLTSLLVPQSLQRWVRMGLNTYERS